MESYEHYRNLEELLSEYDTLSRAIEHTESFLEFYTIESMEGADLEMAEHYLENIFSNVGLSFESISFEDSTTPASDSAVAESSTSDKPTESKSEKLKNLAKKGLETMKEKLKKLPEEIKKYSELLINTMTNSTKGLSNTAKQLLDKLEGSETVTGKIGGSYSIFSSVRPQSALGHISKGLSSLRSESDKAIKQIIGDGNITSNLKLYSFSGTEFSFDGTNKFFDNKLKSDKTEISALNKSDIKLVCESVIKLSEDVEALKKSLPDMNKYIDSIVNKNFAAGAGIKEAGKGIKDGSKTAFALAGFYRSVIGGYIKYTIKVSKIALACANGSIKN